MDDWQVIVYWQKRASGEGGETHICQRPTEVLALVELAQLHERHYRIISPKGTWIEGFQP